ncbi:MAG: site-2 protease family protein [Candidatus Aenigmarchaeota archaeon]|nr:site-2 protease family protein [Candidatus Aenigmarchaeota archaeon]
MFDLYSVSVLIFITALVFALYKDRKNLERNSIMLLRRTERGKGLIKKIANACPFFWKWLGNAGIVIGFAVSVYITYFMIESLFKSITSETAVSTLSVVVPSISSTTSMGPGYLAVPFWYWIISIALLVVVHEGLHGIMTIIGKTRIKSLGWGVMAILPLAFVEPDEKALQKKSLVTRLRVYAAGSLSNFIFALIYLGIFSLIASTLFIPSGVSYAGTFKDYPADNANLTGAIINIDGYQIRNQDDLTLALERIGVNKTITVVTFNGTDNLTFTLQTTNPQRVEFKPDMFTDFVISLESNFPGTVKLLNSLSGLSETSTESWQYLTYEKRFWEYAKSTAASIAGDAEIHISEIERALEGRNEPGFIGIGGISAYHTLKDDYKNAESGISFFQGLLFFLFILNLGVGLANLLPIIPLDGGKMWDDLLKKYIPARAELITKILAWSVFLIIIAGFVIPFLK